MFSCPEEPVGRDGSSLVALGCYSCTGLTATHAAGAEAVVGVLHPCHG